MSDDDTYEIPLQDQRAFGAGIKRKRVQFVPSTSATSSTAPAPSASSAKSISDLYLKLVLPKDIAADDTLKSQKAAAESGPQTESHVCEICSLPVSSTDSTTIISDDDPAKPTDSATAYSTKERPHEASLAHQVCLTHSHPPSHLDRNRKGLTYLSSYGWDPDSRLGLGASGQGIQFPIKAKVKNDKLGLGVVLPKEAERRRKEKPEKLDAGKIRKLQEKDRKKGERLRDMFYRSEDLDRYLGTG